MPSLELDARVGTDLTVRKWSHDGRVFAGPSAAHAGIEIGWVESGAIGYRIGASDVEIGEGDAMIVPRAVEHATGFLTPSMRGGSVHVGGDRVAEIADTLGVRERRIAPARAEDGATVVALGKALVRELSRRDDGHLFAAEAIADALVVHALRASREVRPHAGARDPRITAALDHLHAEYAEPLGVADLARAAGMSRFHFSRLFQEQVGDPPYRYLQRVRVRRGAEMLRAGRHSVTETALAVGFRDFGRFARAFRREMGCLPGEMARSRQVAARA